MLKLTIGFTVLIVALHNSYHLWNVHYMLTAQCLCTLWNWTESFFILLRHRSQSHNGKKLCSSRFGTYFINCFSTFFFIGENKCHWSHVLVSVQRASSNTAQCEFSTFDTLSSAQKKVIRNMKWKVGSNWTF